MAQPSPGDPATQFQWEYICCMRWEKKANKQNNNYTDNDVLTLIPVNCVERQCTTCQTHSLALWRNCMFHLRSFAMHNLYRPSRCHVVCCDSWKPHFDIWSMQISAFTLADWHTLMIRTHIPTTAPPICWFSWPVRFTARTTQTFWQRSKFY